MDRSRRRRRVCLLNYLETLRKVKGARCEPARGGGTGRGVCARVSPAAGRNDTIYFIRVNTSPPADRCVRMLCVRVRTAATSRGRRRVFRREAMYSVRERRLFFFSFSTRVAVVEKKM